MFKDVLKINLASQNHKLQIKVLLLVLMISLEGCSGAVLFNPAGHVAANEKTLIITAALVMLLVVLPAIFMTILFAWRFRASNKDALYDPEFHSSLIVEAVIWIVPSIIVLSLSVLVWFYSIALDPYHPIKPSVKPLVIDVVSMDWKWLFIYPEQQIATVNQVEFPANVPVHFYLTSDSVMNSFFIPQLGSQIMTMGGMQTQLYLIADKPGTYDGLSANFSGEGFTGMTFKATASSEQQFEDWIASVKKSPKTLDQNSYHQLSNPSAYQPVEYYATVQPDLLTKIIQMTGQQTPLTPYQGQE